MNRTPIVGALRSILDAEGARVLQDPARLQTVLQARIGRSSDEQVGQLVTVLKTMVGQRFVAAASERRLDPGEWALKLADSTTLTVEEATGIINMLSGLLGESQILPDPAPEEIIRPDQLGTALEVVDAEPRAIIQIANSPDGKSWAIGDAAMHLSLLAGDKTLWTVDVRSSSNKVIAQRIRRIAFSPDSATIVIAFTDRLAAFSAEDGLELWTYSPPTLFSFLVQGPSDVAFLNANQILVPLDEGSLNVWNIGGWNEKRRRMSVAPRMIALLADGETFLGSDGSQTFVWGLHDFKRRWRVTRERVYSVAAIPDMGLAAARTLDELLIVDSKNQQILSTIDVEPGLPLLAASPLAPQFAIGAEFGASVVDATGCIVGRVATSRMSRLTALAYSSDGETLALGGIDGTVTYAKVAVASA